MDRCHGLAESWKLEADVIDLHTHSNYSDGSDHPAVVVDRAVAAGLTVLSLADHDTFEGIPEAANAAEGRIGFIPGAELSVDWGGRAMHMLAYWAGPGPTPLADALQAIRDSRAARNQAIVVALQDLGIAITMDEVIVEAGHGVAGRPHIAAVLVDKGVVDSIASAFDRYLAAGRPAYRPRMRLGAPDAVRLTRESGGVTVVAHPHTVADHEEDFRATIVDIAELGVDGVECYYSEYPPELRRDLAGWTNRLGLVPTGGSDYHGTYKPGLSIGIGYGDLEVPDDVAERLEDRRKG
jgi:predicted metal-dependent phosphoesterase TrpH